MKKAVFLGFIFIVLSFFISCARIDIDEYQGREPKVTLEGFFSGDLVAYGIVRNRSGKVIRHFQAALKGNWQNGTGLVDEVFWFDDGERQTRLWKMVKQNNGSYLGTANDVEGEALIQVEGNAIRLNYRLIVPYKDKEVVLSMDDWMYQVAPGVVMNETSMSKWGFGVGKVTLVIMKSEVIQQIPALIDRFTE